MKRRVEETWEGQNQFNRRDSVSFPYLEPAGFQLPRSTQTLSVQTRRMLFCTSFHMKEVQRRANNHRQMIWFVKRCRQTRSLLCYSNSATHRKNSLIIITLLSNDSLPHFYTEVLPHICLRLLYCYRLGLFLLRSFTVSDWFPLKSDWNSSSKASRINPVWSLLMPFAGGSLWRTLKMAGTCLCRRSAAAAPRVLCIVMF